MVHTEAGNFAQIKRAFNLKLLVEKNVVNCLLKQVTVMKKKKKRNQCTAEAESASNEKTW